MQKREWGLDQGGGRRRRWMQEAMDEGRVDRICWWIGGGELLRIKVS